MHPGSLRRKLVSSFARKVDAGTANTGRGKNLDPENSLNDHLETGAKSKWVVPMIYIYSYAYERRIGHTQPGSHRFTDSGSCFVRRLSFPRPGLVDSFFRAEGLFQIYLKTVG
jgi:hypothetical protein